MRTEINSDGGNRNNKKVFENLGWNRFIRILNQKMVSQIFGKSDGSRSSEVSCNLNDDKEYTKNLMCLAKTFGYLRKVLREKFRLFRLLCAGFVAGTESVSIHNCSCSYLTSIYKYFNELCILGMKSKWLPIVISHIILRWVPFSH